MNRKLLFVFICIGVIFIIFKAISLFESDQDKISSVIYSAKEATEKENIFKCMSHISNAYSDKDGNNKAALFRITKHAFSVYDNILIEITDLDISIVDKSMATAHIICFGQGKRRIRGKIQYSLDSRKIEFNVEFRKEGNRWKVVELRFISPPNFLRLIEGL